MRITDILETDFVSIEANEPMTQLFGQLAQHKQVEAIITDSGAYEGMFDHRLLPKPNTITPEIKIRTITGKAPRIRTNDEVLTVAKRMFESGHNMLPVFEDDKLVGVVRSGKVLQALRDLPELEGTRIRDIRHPQVLTVKEDEGIGVVFAHMHNRHVNHFPVVDEKNEVVGFLSLLDLIQTYYLQPQTSDRGMAPKAFGSKAFKAEKPNLVALPVSNFMNNTFVITIAENSTVREAIDAVIENKIHSLVLLKDDEPHRIVTTRDLLEAAIDSQIRPIERIQYKGINELDLTEFDKYWVDKICSYYVDSLELRIPNEFDVIVHVKESSRTGNRHRFTAGVRVSYPGAPVVAVEAEDWDIRTVLHRAFQELETVIEHKFKTEHVDSVKKLAAQEGDDNLPGDLTS
jgi:CBS domain-containing protein